MRLSALIFVEDYALHMFIYLALVYILRLLSKLCVHT